ncbi:DUF4595 domain-containing protein [Prevotella histicola]|jgi:lipoprotein|uniref:DUF4595 domain-containing protein n=1 Tax=Prevotella histicola TaxID=470565 RepID=UPI001C5D034B|nr:DUF4595 domain-containing protein [Prevotella histicola]MBW4712934.1 DUF4595 domain-containing protein [Prevotella histicola]MBW4877704.1 DUF4595 domain-containing protein [Prevotella histicola]MBW4921696.1 DUF4595 domain-containing protein [Prevotella histicola]
MKKTITIALLAVAVIGATFVLSSCSNKKDDDWIIERRPDPVTIDLSKVFTNGMPKEVDSMTIQTDDRGLVTGIKTKDETVSFKYNNTKTRAIVIPNVFMKVERNGDTTVYIMFLGKNGFVRGCKKEQKENTKEDTWYFTYNDNDQLTNITHSADINKIFTLTYKDGNISEIETKTILSPATTKQKDTCKVAYTSTASPTPIVNKGNIMLFNTTFGIDMGAIRYAYYAGLLGKATKNLPVQLIDKNGNKNNFTWIVNSNGFPTAMTSSSHQYKFGW